MNKYVWLLAILLISTELSAQIGGREVYNFLAIPNSARLTALGSHHIAALDGDTDLAFSNPALLNEQMDQRIGFSHQFYVGDIGSGYLSFARHHAEKQYTWHASLRYVGYGELDRTDELGNQIGTFNSSDLALTAGVGKQLYDRMRVGANVRVILGQLEDYQSIGVAADLGALYQIKDQDLNFAFVIKNIGAQLTRFDEASEQLPLDIQLGMTKRLKYLPFQFSVVAQQMHRWDIRYDDPNADDEDDFIDGQDPVGANENAFIDNLFRHLVFNGELFVGQEEQVKLRIGYNHLRKRELSIENYRTLAGFSFGFGIKINRFYIDYGFGRYHIGGAGNHFTISTNIQEFTKTGITD